MKDSVHSELSSSQRHARKPRDPSSYGARNVSNYSSSDGTSIRTRERRDSSHMESGDVEFYASLPTYTGNLRSSLPGGTGKRSVRERQTVSFYE